MVTETLLHRIVFLIHIVLNNCYWIFRRNRDSKGTRVLIFVKRTLTRISVGITLNTGVMAVDVFTDVIIRFLCCYAYIAGVC